MARPPRRSQQYWSRVWHENSHREILLDPRFSGLQNSSTEDTVETEASVGEAKSTVKPSVSILTWCDVCDDVVGDYDVVS